MNDKLYRVDASYWHDNSICTESFIVSLSASDVESFQALYNVSIVDVPPFLDSDELYDELNRLGISINEDFKLDHSD